MGDTSTITASSRLGRRTRKFTLVGLITRPSALASRLAGRARPVADVEYRAVLDALHRPPRPEIKS